MSCAEIQKDVFTKVAGGDARSWEYFVKSTQDHIQATVKGVLRRYSFRLDESDVREVVQETYLRLINDNYRLLKSFDSSRAGLSAWVSVIARSAAVDWLRRQRPGRADSDALEAIPSEAPRGQEPAFPRPELTRRQNQIMHLLFDRDMDVDDVAFLLEISEQTVRSVRHQSLERLRQTSRLVGRA